MNVNNPVSSTADNLLQVVKSSFLDSNYLFNDDWKVNNIKFNSTVDVNEYVDKITQFQAKGHPIDEMFAYLLFSNVQISQNAAFKQPTCSFMHFLKNKPWSPSQNLGFFDQGIVLFKSADPLLKLAKKHKLRAPKIVIYKVIAGRKKSQRCSLQNVCSKQPTLTNDFDSCDIKLDLDVRVHSLDLNIHCRLSELFLHDFKTVKRDGKYIDVVKSCPRQVLPFAVLNLRTTDVSSKKRVVMKASRHSLRSKGKMFPSFYRYLSCCNCCETTGVSNFVKSNTSIERKKTLIKRNHAEPSPPQIEDQQSLTSQSMGVESSPSNAGCVSMVSDVKKLQCDNSDANNERSCAAVEQQDAYATEIQNRTNCGQCIDDLLSGVSDQSLLELCKDAGLLSASSQSFPDLGFNAADTGFPVSFDPSKIAGSSECSPGTSKCVLPLETVEDANMSLLDDICKLIEDEFDSNLPAALDNPTVSAQQDSMLAETSILTSHNLLQTETGALQQESISPLAPEDCGGGDRSISPQDNAAPDQASSSEIVRTLPTMFVGKGATDQQTSSKAAATPPPKRKRKKYSRKRVNNFVRKIKDDLKSGVVKPHKDSSGKKASITNHVEYLNKNYEDIKEERLRKQRLYRFYQPRCGAEIRYVASPTKEIYTLSSIPALDTENFKQKRSISKKILTSLSRNCTSFCDTVSAELANKATQSVIEPVRPPTTIRTLVKTTIDKPSRPKKRASVATGPLKCTSNLVAPTYLAPDSPCGCNCHCKQKLHCSPRKLKKFDTLRFQPYTVLYRIVPYLRITDCRRSKISAQLLPANSSCNRQFVWIRKSK